MNLKLVGCYRPQKPFTGENEKGGVKVFGETRSLQVPLSTTSSWGVATRHLPKPGNILWMEEILHQAVLVSPMTYRVSTIQGHIHNKKKSKKNSPENATFE